MKVITEGHRYHLKNHEVPDNYQELQFIHKEYANGYLSMVKDGVQNIEVLTMLLDRYQYLQSRLDCNSNSKIIALLQECIVLEEERDKDRN